LARGGAEPDGDLTHPATRIRVDAGPPWYRDLAARLRRAGAVQLGAVDVGTVVASHEWAEVGLHLRRWLADGRHADMHWLADVEATATRLDPRARYPWIRSAFAVAFPYDTLPDPDAAVSLGQGVVPADDGVAKISRYAHGTDYHRALGKRLERSCKAVVRAHPDRQLRYYLDTGPVLERQWAERAGLGWLGRNTLLIHPRLGSYFFLSIIFADAPAPEAARLEPVPDRCGSCRACVDACPTGALDGRSLDSRRCLSYLTIEARDDPAPAPLVDGHSGWLLGCDICQQVCPWNRRFSLPTADPAFAPLPVYAALSPAAFAAQTADQFRDRFRRTPLWRPRLPKLVATLRLLAEKPKDKSVRGSDNVG
jgi:epoxyqueuosine reductase